MRKSIVLLLFLILGSFQSYGQCTATNTAFKAGEHLVYDLYFNWKFIWLKAGSASMSIRDTHYRGVNGYRCDLITRGSKRADRFFVMRDTLVSIISHNMAPLYYRKGALEGKRYKVDEVWYSYPHGHSHIKQYYKNPSNKVTIQEKQSTECIYDMLSMMLRARSFNANNFKVNQKIKFLMADGDDVETQTLIYRGKKKFKMENADITYRCLVFSFVEYKKGKEKEVVTFYITDDKNHLPVRLDMFLNFGSAKAFLTGFQGVRNPMSSIIRD